MISSLTKCSCAEEGTTYGFNDGSFSDNDDASTAFDLSGVSLELCDITKSNKTLSKNSVFSFDGKVVLVYAKTQFYITNQKSPLSLNLKSSVSSEIETVDSLVSATISVALVVDKEEVLVSWYGFEEIPMNMGADTWASISNSWHFFKTSNSSTNTDIVSDVILLLEDTKLAGETKTIFLTREFERTTVTVECLWDENDEVSLVSTSITNGVRSTKITNQNSPLEIYTSFRDIYCFDLINQVFMSSSKQTNTYTLFNELEDSISVQYMSAVECSKKSFSACCC